jgi:hypothetical protein
MSLPDEVHRRLAARAATDPDVASLLAMATTSDETVSETPLDPVTGDSETTKV